MSIDIGRSVTYPFEDEQWRQKLIMLLILSFIPGMNVLAWGGYALSIARNIYYKQDFPMPAWDAWSDILVRGLLSLVATVIYWLPLLVGGCCLAFVGLVPGLGAAELGIRCATFIFIVAYYLLSNLILNAGHVAFARTDQFFSYLHIRARLAEVRAMPSIYTTLTAYLTVISVVVGLLVIVGVLVIIYSINAVIINGTGLALVAIPFMLVVLVALIALCCGAFLANGYFTGLSAILSDPQRA